MIGDTYEFTGHYRNHEDGTVQTHVYKSLNMKCPNDAPQIDVPKLFGNSLWIGWWRNQICDPVCWSSSQIDQLHDYRCLNSMMVINVQTRMPFTLVHECKQRQVVSSGYPMLVMWMNSVIIWIRRKGRHQSILDRTTEEHGITCIIIKHKLQRSWVRFLVAITHREWKRRRTTSNWRRFRWTRKTIGDLQICRSYRRWKMESATSHAPIKYMKYQTTHQLLILLV